MERIINATPKYDICISDQECLDELSRFVVEENYKHHSTAPDCMDKLESEITSVYNEEKELYTDTSSIYIARCNNRMIGSIRVFKWDKKKTLPIEKMYGINPIKAMPHSKHAEYWHVGRFAIDSSIGISPVTLFKQLMVYAVKPIVSNENGYMVAEIDAKLLRIVNALGIHTVNLGESVYYLSSETIPIIASQKGIIPFYTHYHELYRYA